MSYSFYLGNLLLPVSPEKLTIKINNQNQTVNLINEGQVNLIKDQGLTEISFEALIPAAEYPFAVYKNGFQPAHEIINEIERLKNDKQPFQFIVSRTRPDGHLLFTSNYKVTMESYSLMESVKDGMDSKITINLKQYKEYGTKRITIVNGSMAAENETRTSKVPTATIHKVTEGDSLLALAKKYYGTGTMYKTIYEANKAVIDDANANSLNRYAIQPGQMLRIVV